MTKVPNPIGQGFAAVRRDPAIFLVEILWRWSFAIIALFVLFGTGLMLLGPLNMGDSFSFAWRTHDTQRLSLLLLSAVLRLGAKLIIAAVALPVIIALVWSVFSAAGRRITVARLDPGSPPLRFGGMLAVQCMRALLTWLAGLLLIGAVIIGIRIATSGSKPDLFPFYMVIGPSVVVIALIWLVVNWYLSMAGLFGRSGQGFRGAFRQARETVARQRSDFAGTGFVFLLLRLVLLLMVLAICGLTSSMAGTAPETYFAMVMAFLLVYCALADVLYMARMAAYVALAAAHTEPDVVELLEASSRASGRDSSLL
ncbi:MAG TPA: hypothetical protein VFT65_12070 [Candidatus Angelobacter sp.]|nr:hypothetical protein [Candidatus Angelobacter sp.]